MGRPFDAPEHTSAGRGSIPGALVQAIWLFHSHHESCDAGGGRVRTAHSLPAFHRVEPGRSRRAGIPTPISDARFAIVLHAKHDGAARYAGNGVYAAGAAVLLAEAIWICRARLRGSCTNERNRGCHARGILPGFDTAPAISAGIILPCRARGA